MYLTARILIPFELDFQAFVSEIVDANSGVVTGNQELNFAIRVVWWVIYCLYPGDFASLCVFTMRRPDMDLCLVLQSFGFIEQT